MYPLGVKYPNVIFHDCYIDEILFDKSHIIFLFRRGSYVFNGIDGYDVRPGKLIIECDRQQRISDNNMSVCSFIREKRKSVDTEKFIGTLNKTGYRIYMDFYSDFGNALYLKGDLDGVETEIMITEIVQSSFVPDRDRIADLRGEVKE